MRHSIVRLIYVGGENNPVGLAAIKQETRNHQREPPARCSGMIYLLTIAIHYDSSAAAAVVVTDTTDEPKQHKWDKFRELSKSNKWNKK